MTVKFTNNANSTLASGINSSVTSMTVADASSFPSLAGANDYCYLTLQESGGTTREIVKATALSSNTFTIVRGQDNTSAATWSSGILVELRVTSALLQDVIDGLGSGSMMDTDIFTGDGSDTTFTLSRQPDDENHLLVFIDGVFQSHSAYSVSGTTLTMSAAPANGRVLTVYHMATTVGGSNLVKATMTGDNSDTTLDVGSQILHENNVQVFFNGVYQSKSNYSVSGSVITFSTAPPTGVAVEAILNTATNISTAAQVSDADNDTLIQVEESADEDKIRFDTAGTERMVLDSTSLTVTPKIVSDAGIDIDNINIDGTTIALSSGDLTLDVAGDIVLDAGGGDIILKDDGTHWASLYTNGTNTYLQNMISDGDIYFTVNDGGSSVNALIIDGSDAGAAQFNSRVGIGVAAHATAGLNVTADGSAQNIRLNNGSELGIIDLDSDGNLTIWAHGDENIRFFNGTGTGTELMRIQNTGITQFFTGDGNSGIAEFHTNASSGNATAYISIRPQGTVRGYIGNGSSLLTGAGNDEFIIRSEAWLDFCTGGNNRRMSISTSGKILIGTTSGSYIHDLGMRIRTNEVGSNALDAALNIEGSGGDFYAQNWTGPSDVGFGMLAAFSPSTDYLSYRYMSGGTVSYDRFTIYADGNLSCAGTLTESTSDERLKSNITLISDPIEKIKSIRGVEFDWKETTPDSVGIAVPHAGKHDVGVIAQEVQKILPDAVSHAPFDNDMGKSVTGENYLTVNYQKLIPVLIEGMKEQQTLIETLEAKVKALEEA